MLSLLLAQASDLAMTRSNNCRPIELPLERRTHFLSDLGRESVSGKNNAKASVRFVFRFAPFRPGACPDSIWHRGNNLHRVRAVLRERKGISWGFYLPLSYFVDEFKSVWVLSVPIVSLGIQGGGLV